MQSTETTAAHPIIWRAYFPADVFTNLVSFDNPRGSVANYNLELAGGILHNECYAQCFDMRECNILAHTDNIPKLWLQQKGFIISSYTPAHILCTQAIRQ